MFFDCWLYLFRFLHNFWNELLLFVILSICLCTDSQSTYFFQILTVLNFFHNLLVYLVLINAFILTFRSRMLRIAPLFLSFNQRLFLGISLFLIAKYVHKSFWMWFLAKSKISWGLFLTNSSMSGVTKGLTTSWRYA